MDYYIYLAVQQQERLRIFEAQHPKNNRLANRLVFFGQDYEIHVSFSISDGLAAQELPPGLPK